jgi:integrase
VVKSQRAARQTWIYNSFGVVERLEPMKFSGTIYLNGSRYWLKVKLPGALTYSQIPLKATGAKYATKDKALALLLAERIWQEALTTRPASYDGRLASLAASYIAWAQSYYLPPSHQAEDLRRAIQPFVAMLPDLLAEEVTPLHLKQWRDILLSQDVLCRKSLNESIRIIQKMFKWGASEMMVSVHVYALLNTLEGLRQGRTTARESKKVPPVPPDAIQPVLRRVSTIVADAIRIQLLTAARPGEVLKLRPCDIDRSRPVWIYRPESHKTAWRGHERIVAIGPQAQAILNAYLENRPADDFCFKPKDSAAEGFERRRLARRTPLNQGNRAGTNKMGTAAYNPYFEVAAYRRAIQRACRAAGIAPWAPHQLRHSAATAVADEFGLDTARAVLGHRSVNVTKEYAAIDLDKAVKVATMRG